MQYRLRTLLILMASFVGAVVGAFAFSSFVGLMPTIPGGQRFAAGLGGLVGLALALILLAIRQQKTLTLAAMPRYSLRTLLILVTATCLLMGYVTNWRHQRYKFLTEQTALRKGDVEHYITKRCERSKAPNNIRTPVNGLYSAPPFLLLPFGERGYHFIAIVVPASDATPQQAKNQLGGKLSAYYILDSQHDYKRAVRLFPEASVFPCVYKDGRIYEVCVRSAASGDIIESGYDSDVSGWEHFQPASLRGSDPANE